MTNMAATVGFEPTIHRSKLWALGRTKLHRIGKLGTTFIKFDNGRALQHVDRCLGGFAPVRLLFVVRIGVHGYWTTN
jgi:hypothetical protein